MSANANVHDENKTTVVMVHDGFSDTLYSELKGKDLKLSGNGLFTTKNPELAAEMVEKYKGHVDIAPFNTDEKPQGRMMYTMPALPYETEWDRKHKEKLNGFQPQDVTPENR
jgi:hypothetical protein